MLELLKHAAHYSIKKRDRRTFYVGAVAIRSDGVMVRARNEAVHIPAPTGHAESRISRKIGPGATVYVARSTRNGELAMAKPCSRCMAIMKSHHVKKIYYTISNEQYGVIEL
jgi:tRNA(Arg) A34 adenosine deaminase TadA